jgi:uncharacterized protein with HEPN domain
MDNRTKKLLFDILSSINNINEYLDNKRVFDYYDNNQMLQDAVERNIEIIGEAMNQILKLNPDISISNSR